MDHSTFLYIYGCTTVNSLLFQNTFHLCPPSTESNERLLEEFSHVATIGDLKVNLGKWRWSPASRRPPWSSLQGAKVWNSTAKRALVTLRQQLQAPPLAA